MRALDVASNGVQVGTLRLHGAADVTRARRRIEAELARLDASALGLPPRAVLVVRRAAPPARLRMSAAAPAAAFGRAVQAELREKAGTARRPWLHADAASAGAVLFADEAELAACLARDWVRGAVGGRWWWHSVLGGLGADEWIRQRVLARGDVLVPVIARLAESSDAVPWLARLGDAEAEHAVAAVVQAYVLPPPEAPFDAPQANAIAGRADARDPGLPSAEAGAVEVATAGVHALRELVRAVPEVRAPVLRAAQRRLLAVALAVERAPSWARTSRLAAALDALDRVEARDLAGLTEESDRPAARRAASARRDVPGAATRSDATGFEDRQDEAGRIRSANVDSSSARAAPSSTASHRGEPISLRADRFAATGDADARDSISRAIEPPPPADAGADISRATESRAPAAAGASEARERPRSPTLSADDEDRFSPPAPPAWAETWAAANEGCGIDIRRRWKTEFGGIFYLLNAALALELYGDFTMPRAAGLGLLPWDWLALVGRAWFGAELVRDPAWELLARLAGRTRGEPPGAYFAAPREWRVPPAWLAPWGDVASVDVHATRTRLRLLHSAGFAVCDVARDPALRPLAQARALCVAYPRLAGAPLRRIHRIGRRGGRTATGRWLRWMLDYLLARLARALDADHPSAVPAFVCRHPAEVRAGSSAVDVHLSLAHLPLEIRIAGLDRDAGWIPAAGRSLSFHFA